MTMMSMDIGDDNAMMNIIWNGGNSETHPVSQLVPLTCLNPAFKIYQSCHRCQYCLSSSSKESSLSLHQDLYDLFSRLIRVSSRCSCSLLLSPCFPDHDGEEEGFESEMRKGMVVLNIHALDSLNPGGSPLLETVLLHHPLHPLLHLLLQLEFTLLLLLLHILLLLLLNFHRHIILQLFLKPLTGSG